MKPLVVSGGGLARSGVAEEMARRGMPLVHFDGFAPNPTAEQVQAGLAMFRAEGCDGILSIGGGSAMDVAKGIKALGETDENDSLLERDASAADGCAACGAADDGWHWKRVDAFRDDLHRREEIFCRPRSVAAGSGDP